MNKTNVKLDALVPVVAGQPYNDGGYFITIGIGTPVQVYILAVDTASDLTWVQSSACTTCFTPITTRGQELKNYNPSQSISRVGVNTDDRLCRAISSIKDFEYIRKRNRDGKIIDLSCRYKESYRDKCSTGGELIVDVLSLGDTKFPNHGIGLGLENVGSRGIFGLGGGRISFVSQAKLRSFSHCFVDFNSAGESTMEFNVDIPNNNQGIISSYIHPRIEETKYYLDLTEVRVNDERIDIPEYDEQENMGGTILDIGAHLSSFVPDVYSKIEAAFTSQIPLVRHDDVVENIKFCYAGKPDVIPTITLVFGRGEENLLILPDDSVLTPLGRSELHCFLFKDGSKPYSAIGNMQLQHFRVYYDVSNSESGQIMFVPRQC
ncbi:Aspartic protease in guard cell [Thalictrum thalictroides]|uniref:Aspartic protease in guard cell n=1 Tax=Thalictrum thalictroides TaxID=46969 RepID=A0A7J6V305_THATH|nr:Aspartic protease in guard cell [Thalictrum thalictroides]